MGSTIGKFLEKPYLSICLLFLITSVSITSYVYSLLKPKDNSISEYYLSENADYFVGDIPADDSGQIDFQKMHKVYWLSTSGWINDEEFKRITDSEYIWLRSKAFSTIENEELHFLLEHAG
ncbi:histidine kinase, partial [Leptospira levettii]